MKRSTEDKYKTTHMNTQRYGNLIESKFAKWRRACFGDDDEVKLVQDFESCLWAKTNLAKLESIGFHVLDNFPKSSPDLNAIEGVWKMLKERRSERCPAPDEIL